MKASSFLNWWGEFMILGAQKVLSFNYTLRDTAGEVLDQSSDGPLTFLTGVGQILPKLEDELKSMLIGQKKNVKLGAADAYGLQDPKMIMDVDKKELAHLQLEIGGFLQMNLGETLKVVKISKITETHVTLDGNHPLAGQDLDFDIELVNSREATAEELSHRHVHGEGGVHH